MGDLSETDKAYIAGFFDGEGCIAIIREINKNHISYTYQLSVSITQLDKEPLERIMGLFGFGTIHQQKSTKTNTLHFVGHFGENFLIEILPYLRQKHNEALLALEFRRETRRPLGHGKAVSQEENALREQYWTEMRSLKKWSGLTRKGDPGMHKATNADS